MRRGGMLRCRHNGERQRMAQNAASGAVGITALQAWEYAVYVASRY